MPQPTVLLTPVSLGFGSAGASPINIGVLRDVSQFVVTGVNAFVNGAVAGPFAPVLQVNFTSGQSLLLGGTSDDVTAVWEAHWLGWLVVPTDVEITIFNANSASAAVITVTVDGYIPTTIYG